MPGDYISHRPCGNGHINDTFVAAFSQGGNRVRYIVQRINQLVFKQPEIVMDNIIRVTTHLADKMRSANEPELHRRVLTLIPCRKGNLWHCDDTGNHWRAYIYIEGASAHDHVDSPVLAREAARSFGGFQQALVDLPGPRLRDTIPNFHNARVRFNTFREAVDNDAADRVATCQHDIDWIMEREEIVDVLLDLHRRGDLPERITHNDTKINNVMIDNVSGEGICIMDLDTVMPGFALYDFGDLIRTTTISCAEDERDLSRVHMRLPLYEALVSGYLSSAGDFLTDCEKENLGFSGKLITFTIGMRFLTDHLNGDTYFKIHRPNHNLDRFRVQAKMVESIENQEDAMIDALEQAASPRPKHAVRV
ncbi:MAG: aminoglycoside phosphotransferase family protein [Verrucomicrobia bacterium]|nr:aminoglycoside phosphotransferase family protein [Verrucomicrobiota bacterium]